MTDQKNILDQWEAEAKKWIESCDIENPLFAAATSESRRILALISLVRAYREVIQKKDDALKKSKLIAGIQPLSDAENIRFNKIENDIEQALALQVEETKFLR